MEAHREVQHPHNLEQGICPPHSELSVASGLLALQPGATQAAIVLHPHPGRGGDMYNPFVVQAVQLAKLSGISTLRFNFSRSEGMGDDETEAEDEKQRSRIRGQPQPQPAALPKTQPRSS